MSERTMRSTGISTLGLVLIPAAAAFGSEEGAGPGLFTGDLGNIIWTLVTFFAVVFVLGKFAWKPILSALQQREQFIRDSLDQAKKDREQAEARLKEYGEKLDRARTDATGIVEEGRRDAEEVRRKILADAKKESDAVAARAKKEIEIARDDAIKKLHDQTILLATSIAGKMVRRDLGEGDHRELLDEALSEMQGF